MDQIREEVMKLRKAELEDAVKKYFGPDTNRALIKERLPRMITYAVERFDWYDEQRNNMQHIALALLAASTGITAVVIDLEKYVVDKTFPVFSWVMGFLMAFTLIVISVWILYIYFQHISPNYIHRDFGDIRSWYFKYNFPSIPSFFLSKDAKERLQQNKDVILNFRQFLDRWFEYALEGEDRFILEDLEQVFILQLLQGYRRKSLEKMKRIFVCGLSAFAFELFLGLISYFIWFISCRI